MFTPFSTLVLSICILTRCTLSLYRPFTAKMYEEYHKRMELEKGRKSNQTPTSKLQVDVPPAIASVTWPQRWLAPIWRLAFQLQQTYVSEAMSISSIPGILFPSVHVRHKQRGSQIFRPFLCITLFFVVLSCVDHPIDRSSYIKRIPSLRPN